MKILTKISKSNLRGEIFFEVTLEDMSIWDVYSENGQWVWEKIAPSDEELMATFPEKEVTELKSHL